MSGSIDIASSFSIQTNNFFNDNFISILQIVTVCFKQGNQSLFFISYWLDLHLLNFFTILVNNNKFRAKIVENSGKRTISIGNDELNLLISAEFVNSLNSLFISFGQNYQIVVA